LLAPETEPFEAPPSWTAPDRTPHAGAADAPTRTWRDQLVMATLGGILRHKFFAVVLVLLAVVAAGVKTLREDPYYIATATIFRRRATRASVRSASRASRI
jgi:hypothetical protein